jgi:hypothetical protein
MSNSNTMDSVILRNSTDLFEFQNLLKAIDFKVKSHYKKFEETGRTIINDGIVDPESYFNAPIKILWLLKEPYCDGKNGGGGWSMCHLLKKIAAGKTKGSSNTWNPIIYASYGILNNFPNYEDIPRISHDHKMPEILLQIGFINLQKLPAEPHTDSLRLKREFDDRNHFEIIKEQLDAYNPDIVIGGKTLHIIKDKLGVQADDELAFGHFKKNKTLFINTYHPAQTEITTAEYVNKIVLRARDWQHVYKH